MKFLHTSDWHLGRSDGDLPLLEDQQYFIDQICNIVKERGVNAVIIAGDVYDRSVASAEAIRLYNRAMTELCFGCGVTVFMIAGNHDSAERLANLGEFLGREGLRILGELSEDITPILFGDAEIFMLPWITEERVKSVFPEEKERITDLSSAYAIVTEKMRAQFSQTKKHILLAHAFVSGAESSTSDRAAEIGTAPRVAAAVFDGFDYVALGHIHGAQSVADNARYCGTPMPYSFGREEAQTKGVILFDTESMVQEFVPLTLLHQRKTLSGTLEALLNPDCTEKVRQGFIRLEVTDSYVGMETLSELKQIYPHILELKGLSYEKDDSTVTLSMEELERMENNPMEVFRYFCREEMGVEADEHMAELFALAVRDAEREEA